MNFTTTIPQRSTAPSGHGQHVGLPFNAIPDSVLPALYGVSHHAHRQGAARTFLDALERALRAPRDKAATALHLSHLKTPPPRPYHTRIAMALMQDTAQRLGGQVYPMSNGDLVLLCNMPGSEAEPGAPSPFTLPASLRRLFGADAPSASLTTIWRLDRESEALHRYVAQCEADPAAPDVSSGEPATSHGLAALEARLRATDVRTLLMQQTAVQLRPGRGLPLFARVSPLFRELIAAPLAPAADGDAELLCDPVIRRHLGDALQARILALVLADLAGSGPITRACLRLGMPMHINLTPAAIIGPEFGRLAQACSTIGARFAVEIAAADAAADPALTGFAVALLAQAGFSLVLDGILHEGVTLIRPDVLEPAWVKLAWSPRLADAQPESLTRIDAAIAAIRPGRIVLQNVDGEAAMVWGQARNITAFQGPYLDAVQAASRIAICHTARACTLRQCTNRALAISPVQRFGCGNPALLDMGGAVSRA